MNEGLDPRTIQISADECGVSDSDLRGIYADVARGERIFWAKCGRKVKDVEEENSMRTQITRETRAAIREKKK